MDKIIKFEIMQNLKGDENMEKLILIIKGLGNVLINVIIDYINSRRKISEQFGQALQELKVLEEDSNACISIYDKEGDKMLYSAYYSKLQNLQKLIGAYKHKIPEKKSNEYEQLCKEIITKLKIFAIVFLSDIDISQYDQEKYYYDYINPDETKIQKLIDELLESPI